MDLALAFLLGVIGSAHCVQMCGPLVVSYSLPLAGTARRTQAFAHLAYNVGRIATYALLGAIAGAIGGAVAFVGGLAGVAQLAAVVGGVLLLVAAAALAGFLPGDGLVRVGVFRPASSLSRAVARLMSSETVTAKVWTGMLLGFLPCGLVYAAVVRAGATGSPVGGAATMAAFGAGTSGALFAVGMCSTWITRIIGARRTQVTAFAVSVMGVVLLLRAFTASDPVSSPHGMHHLGGS